MITLPDNLVRSQTNITVEMWFNTSSYGILIGYQDNTYPATNFGAFVPLLFVDTDGKLKGYFYQGCTISHDKPRDS